MRSYLIALVVVCIVALHANLAEAGRLIGRNAGCSSGGGCGSSGGCGSGGGGCSTSGSSQGCNIQPQVSRASAADLLQQPAAPVVNPAIEAEARAKAKAAAIATAERRKHTLPFAYAWSNPVSQGVDGKVGKQLYASK